MPLFSLFIPSHKFSIRLRSWLWFSHPRASTVLSLPLLENKSSMKLQLSCRSAFPPWSPCISLHAFTLTSLPKTYCRGACTQSFWSDKKPPLKNYIKSTLIHCFRTMKHEIHFFICTLCASEQHRVLTVLCHYQGHMNCLCQGRTQLHTQTHCTEPHLFHSAAFALFLLIQIDSSCH